MHEIEVLGSIPGTTCARAPRTETGGAPWTSTLVSVLLFLSFLILCLSHYLAHLDPKKIHTRKTGLG